MTNKTNDGVPCELPPCECGSADVSVGYESPQGYWVECGDCGYQTEKSHGRELVVAKWHARVATSVDRQQDAKGPLCFCGLRQTKNPHPEAGVPPGYLEVGTVYDCIPCLNKSRRAWSKRANKAEGELKDLKAKLDERKSWMDRLVEYCTESGIPEDLLAEYKAISADKKTGD